MDRKPHHPTKKPDDSTLAAPVLQAPGKLRTHDAWTLLPAPKHDHYAVLRDDIAEHGIETPLEVNSAGVVLDGGLRLQAALELSLAAVPVRAIAPADEVAYVLRASLLRRQLSPLQRAVIVLKLLDHEQATQAAIKRSRGNLKQNAEVATSPPRNEKTRKRFADIARVGERLIQDLVTVRSADANLFEKVCSEQVKAHVAATQVRRARRDSNFTPNPPVPDGTFELIYADPAWQLGNPNGQFAPEKHYPTLPLEQILALQPPAAEDALLLLWVVNMLLPAGLQVLQQWGFEYATNLVWVKPSIGLGNWARNRHELLLLGKRGQISPAARNRRPDSVIEAARGRHSEKPACVYELIERAWPDATKLELFARGKPRPGWAAWGNEVER